MHGVIGIMADWTLGIACSRTPPQPRRANTSSLIVLLWNRRHAPHMTIGFLKLQIAVSQSAIRSL